MFYEKKYSKKVVAVFGLLLLVIPFLLTNYLDFNEHVDKRGVKIAKEKGLVADTIWDPISKIDVVKVKDHVGNLLRYHVAYDGGSQSTFFFPFNGNFKELRSKVESSNKMKHKDDFWFPGVVASHYLKRDTNARVLIIGSGGGQETKAALTFGASHVDAIEMVNAVIKLGKGKYSSYIGNIFNNKSVSVINDEGRSFIRTKGNKYDIIQIFSNHTSSSIASGNGAIAPVYLQTADAYREYFQHLKSDGILHINHNFYPLMVAAAARAWNNLGRDNFRDHVIVFVRDDFTDNYTDSLPTLLINMQPWTQDQVDALRYILSKDPATSILMENPLNHRESFLDNEFYSGHISSETKAKANYRLNIATDNEPYMNFIRKKFSKLRQQEKGSNMTKGMVNILNSQLRSGIPMDSIHLIVTAFFSVVFSILFIYIPLKFSRVGKENWPGKYHTLAYFSCLGTGFIIIELVLIQIFMKFIGFPLYTYAIVIFSLLLSAGVGSGLSGWLKISPVQRWYWPFLGVISYGTIFLLWYPDLFNIFIAEQISIRCLVAFIAILPLGVFLGMPFPLGIMLLEKQPKGAIAWAWGMNGLFTTIGGLLSVVMSVYMGFQLTILLALFLYLIALIILFSIISNVRVKEEEGAIIFKNT